jgi:cadmium resistance protein CadD (predicted permease)
LKVASGTRGKLPRITDILRAVSLFAVTNVDDGERGPADGAPGVLGVAAVTAANGGDNVGVYVPVLATTGSAATYVAVFLVLVAVWCAAGRLVAGRRPVARVLTRWGHVVLPVVLVGVGVAILLS